MSDVNLAPHIPSVITLTSASFCWRCFDTWMLEKVWECAEAKVWTFSAAAHLQVHFKMGYFSLGMDSWNKKYLCSSHSVPRTQTLNNCWFSQQSLVCTLQFSIGLTMVQWNFPDAFSLFRHGHAAYIFLCDNVHIEYHHHNIHSQCLITWSALKLLVSASFE